MRCIHLEESLLKRRYIRRIRWLSLQCSIESLCAAVCTLGPLLGLESARTVAIISPTYCDGFRASLRAFSDFLTP